MLKFWLYCGKDRLVSYKYDDEVSFDLVLNDVLQYFNLKDIEIIKENKKELKFKANFNGINSLYKIIKF